MIRTRYLYQELDENFAPKSEPIDGKIYEQKLINLENQTDGIKVYRDFFVKYVYGIKTGSTKKGNNYGSTYIVKDSKVLKITSEIADRATRLRIDANEIFKRFFDQNSKSAIQEIKTNLTSKLSKFFDILFSVSFVFLPIFIFARDQNVVFSDRAITFYNNASVKPGNYISVSAPCVDLVFASYDNGSNSKDTLYCLSLLKSGDSYESFVTKIPYWSQNFAKIKAANSKRDAKSEEFIYEATGEVQLYPSGLEKLSNMDLKVYFDSSVDSANQSKDIGVKVAKPVYLINATKVQKPLSTKFESLIISTAVFVTLCITTFALRQIKKVQYDKLIIKNGSSA